MNKGDIGHHMYFISMGEVEILPNKDATPLATLKEGDMFGEVASYAIQLFIQLMITVVMMHID